MSPESRLRTLIESDNFMKNFKIDILSEKNGEVKLKIILEDRFMRMGDVVNAGIIAGLFDISGALSVFTIPDVFNAFTLSLNVTFLTPLTGDYCIITSRVNREGGRHAFIEMSIDDQSDNTVATAHGIWAISR